MLARGEIDHGGTVHPRHGTGGSRPFTVAFLLVRHFSLIAFSTAIEPLRTANRLTEQQLYRWVVLSADGNPVAASNGLSVIPDAGIGAYADEPGRNREIDLVIVCAGTAVERWHDPAVFGWLRRMERSGSAIGAVSTGAYALARAGLLDGYRCAIHWESLDGFRETFPKIEATADLFEVDRNRYTCSGGTAALDMMLYIIGEHHGARLATRISEITLVDRIRGPQDRQRLPLRARLGIHNQKLVSAIELMEGHISEPISQEAIATRIGLSRRQLERLFRKHLGRSPAQYYLELRLERARHLLYQSDMPILDLALTCGFVSASHFSKCYREMYGKSPREERQAAQAIA